MKISIRVEGRGGSLPSFFLEPALQNLRHALLGYAKTFGYIRLLFPLTDKVHNLIPLRAIWDTPRTAWAHLYTSLCKVSPYSCASHAILLTDLNES